MAWIHGVTIFSRQGISVWTYPVLLFQNFRRVVLLVGDVDALEAVDVPRQAGLVDVRLAGLNGLHKGVVNEYVLKK